MKKQLGTALLFTSLLPGGARAQQPRPEPPKQSDSAPASLNLPKLPPDLFPELSPPPLFPVKDTDYKFRMDDLMTILKDNNHESWVMTAYPDPKTALPLIGAGFSLGIMEQVPHPQLDPGNANPFLEPSTDMLWAAAGLAPEKLETIRGVFHDGMKRWGKTVFRQRLAKGLVPDIPGFMEEDADKLERISILQAIYNAKAYARDFDSMTASQQMGMVQLVYQIGTNLEEFTDFLNTINKAHVRDPKLPELGKPPRTDTFFKPTGDHWKDVQLSLMHSQWYRKYQPRSVKVTAMFDPEYDFAHPRAAEVRVIALERSQRPPAKHPAQTHTQKYSVAAQEKSSSHDVRSH